MKVRYIGKDSSPLSLITGKFYECLGFDELFCRVIDETDEDYLYPIGLFRNADTPWNGETVGINEDDEFKDVYVEYPDDTDADDDDNEIVWL